MTASPFDHPYLSGLLGDTEISAFFSAEADIRAMLSFEAALAQAQADHAVVSKETSLRIAEVCATFQPDVLALRHAVATDGVVIPELVRQLRKAIGGEAADKVHFGATSQDVIDTSLMLRLKAASNILSKRLANLIGSFDHLVGTEGANRLMGHTRMQAAIPITVADRICSWSSPLTNYRDRLDQLQKTAFPIQFGGAAGTLEKLDGKASAVRSALAESLKLSNHPQWHCQRATIADFAHLLSLISGSLGKFGQDIALLAQSGTEIELSGGGGSSAMPHKQNPVAAETLVALARFNAVQLSGIHQSMVHEQERSGAAWTLEWMILPHMVIACGASLRLAGELTGKIERLGSRNSGQG
ncbi:3-carboxy-cis,cis-muconate cycloisomerase [Rhizobium sp. Root483D2]|uniref:3-carboxy-cis,cis-muconate cycloisomerase n=1 Tax=Rhizobium sp. Root483D2 TaxID=1736545 RepID=UPI0007157BB4|nr:3-carboxy-cis,cis-muconate cycloisomerase [Rhizobium sp. Root483D2]KQY36065.1 3-carboxy-cis,cis-muconate cycloisomerase [Rhizobium sp. Root483D2]